MNFNIGMLISMNLEFNIELAKNYRSKTQVARVLSENWVLKNTYCPKCGNERLTEYNNNNPAADFFCNKCTSDFELKSSKSHMDNKIVDGAYEIMIQKILSMKNPHIFFLNYTLDYSVRNFFCIPKYFFTPEIIEKRKALSNTARRAGWIGCNILTRNLPQSGKIFLIKEKKILEQENVVNQWAKTSFLATTDLKNRGWLIELIAIIESLSKIFTLSEVYNYEHLLQSKFPNNRFVKEKIRQQLQVLRDKGIIEFIGKGIYQKLN